MLCSGTILRVCSRRLTSTTGHYCSAGPLDDRSRRNTAVLGIEVGCCAEIGVFLSREGPETLEATFSSAGLPTFAITLDNKVHVSLVARSRRFDPSCFPTPEQAARAGYLRLTTGATTPMQAVERPRGRGYTSNDQCRRRSAAKSHAIALKSPFRDLSEVLTHSVRGRNLESVRGAGGLGCGDFQRHCRGVSGLSTAGQPRGSRKRMCDPSLRNAAYGFTYDHPCSCNSITLTTPELTVCACGIRGMSFSSAFFIFS